VSSGTLNLTQFNACYLCLVYMLLYAYNKPTLGVLFVIFLMLLSIVFFRRIKLIKTAIKFHNFVCNFMLFVPFLFWGFYALFDRMWSTFYVPWFSSETLALYLLLTYLLTYLTFEGKVFSNLGFSAIVHM